MNLNLRLDLLRRERSTIGELDLRRGMRRRCDYDFAGGVSLLGVGALRVAHLLHLHVRLRLHARLRNIHHDGRVLVLSVLEATALATITARNAAQEDGDDNTYGDSCDEAFIDEAAVIRGAGTADFVRAQRVFAPPLFVFLAEKAALARVVVAISGAHIDATLI